MPYIEGFVAAVPTANRDVYVEHAKEAAGYFKNLGATRVRSAEARPRWA